MKVDVYLLVFLYYTSIIIDIGYSYILWSLVTNIPKYLSVLVCCVCSHLCLPQVGVARPAIK